MEDNFMGESSNQWPSIEYLDGASSDWRNYLSAERLYGSANRGPYDEFRNAFFGYYAYWGTYTINDAGTGKVHHVQGSERPREVGLKYQRSVSIDGTKLVITTPSYKAGLSLPHDRLEQLQIPADEELVNRLTFERIEITSRREEYGSD